MDAITVTGTDTTIGGLAWTLGDQTYDQWAAAYHADVAANEPNGCDGGDPSSWPAVTVGDRQGHWLQMCNAALAIVPVDGKVYVFSWESSTFDSGSHLDPLDFKTVLLTVEVPRCRPIAEPPDGATNATGFVPVACVNCLTHNGHRSRYAASLAGCRPRGRGRSPRNPELLER